MRKSIHIAESEYMDVIEHLNKQYNMSRYICDLVRADIKTLARNDMEKKDNEQIINALNSLILNSTQKNMAPIQHQSVITNDVIKNKKNIFGVNSVQ